MLRQRSRQLQFAVKANLRGDDSVHQRIQGRISQGFEHLLCVCGTGAEMTINKGHRILLLVGANRRGVTSRYCDESNTLKCPTSPQSFASSTNIRHAQTSNSSASPKPTPVRRQNSTKSGSFPPKRKRAGLSQSKLHIHPAEGCTRRTYLACLA